MQRLPQALVTRTTLLLLSVVLAGCASETPETINFGYLNITASLPLFIAEENGYFAEADLTVETHQVATSDQLVDGVTAGTLDAFIEASAVPVLAAELQSPGRLTIFSVSSMTSDVPFDALLVKEDSSISTLSDLEGRRVGVFPGTTAANLLKKFLEDRGIGVSDDDFVPMPPENHLTALLDGSVDVVHAYEPMIAIALSEGGVRRLYGSVYAEMLDQNPQGVAVVSTALLQNQPGSARAAIEALERGMAFMRDHEQEARDILARRLGLPPGVADEVVFLYMLPHDEIDGDVFQEYANMLRDIGELGGTVDVGRLLYTE